MDVLNKLPHPKKSISLQADFPAKILAMQEAWKEFMANGRDYGLKCGELFALLDLNMQSLKTVQLYLFEDSKRSFATLPKSGMMHNGRLYRTQLLDTLIDVRDCTLLPTPTKSDNKAQYKTLAVLIRYLESGHQVKTVDVLLRKGFSKLAIVNILEL